MLGTKETIQEIRFETASMAISYFENNMEQLIKIREMEKVVFYKNSKGEEFQNQTEEILRHLINHGTYHRGNASAMLHQLGEKSISTDYIFYLREK